MQEAVDSSDSGEKSGSKEPIKIHFGDEYEAKNGTHDVIVRVVDDRSFYSALIYHRNGKEALAAFHPVTTEDINIIVGSWELQRITKAVSVHWDDSSFFWMFKRQLDHEAEKESQNALVRDLG